MILPQSLGFFNWNFNAKESRKFLWKSLSLQLDNWNHSDLHSTSWYQRFSEKQLKTRSKCLQKSHQRISINSENSTSSILWKLESCDSSPILRIFDPKLQFEISQKFPLSFETFPLWMFFDIYEPTSIPFDFFLYEWRNFNEISLPGKIVFNAR